jgi:CheY-like chemotaxis protein
MKPLRILVVEDDAVIGMLLSEMLADMGHDVCGVEVTEAAAVAAATRHRPDLMIVDAWLADGTGVSAVAQILRAGWVPHVFISGARIQPERPGAVALQKPFLQSDLVRAIQRALEPETTASA